MLTEAPTPDWFPYCGQEYPLERTAGRPVICDRSIHGPDVKHHNSELGWSWW
jgi:hypothetical protein